MTRRIDFLVWEDGRVDIKLYVRTDSTSRWRLLGDPTHEVRITWSAALELFDVTESKVFVRMRNSKFLAKAEDINIIIKGE